MKSVSESYTSAITVVVPVFNRESLIERTLDSIHAQNHRPVRLIVVDNDSTDNSLEVARRWSVNHISDDFSIKVLSEQRKGAPFARQRGLEAVETEKVMFFDSDDTMHPDCLHTIISEWEKSPTADIVAWPVVIHFPGRPRETHPIKGNLLEQHLVHGILRTHGYAIKTDYLKKAGGWDGRFPAWNDFETGVRILVRNPEVIAIERPLVDIFPQADGITGCRYSDKAGVWEKSLGRIAETLKAADEKSRKRLGNIVCYRMAILAATYAKEGHPELAEPLYRQAVGEVQKTKRPLIRFAYQWTRLGMRGAFSIIGKFL